MNDSESTRIKELADAEAERAEADEADEEAETETGAGDETEPAEGDEAEPVVETERAPPTEAEVKRHIDRLDKEDERHTKRYAEILGADFESMQPCPRCLTSGHIYPFEAAPIEPEQIAAVDASLGRDVAADLKQATDATICEACDGWGMVLTGAKNEQGRVKPCTPCAGQGWVSPAATITPLPTPPTPAQTTNGEGAAAASVPLPDAWGRPQGHPHWGQDPAAIGV